jgi:hypothetical protein
MKNLWTDPMDEGELINLAWRLWDFDYSKGCWP